MLWVLRVLVLYWNGMFGKGVGLIFLLGFFDLWLFFFYDVMLMRFSWIGCGDKGIKYIFVLFCVNLCLIVFFGFVLMCGVSS